MEVIQEGLIVKVTTILTVMMVMTSRRCANRSLSITTN